MGKYLAVRRVHILQEVWLFFAFNYYFKVNHSKKEFDKFRKNLRFNYPLK